MLKIVVLRTNDITLDNYTYDELNGDAFAKILMQYCQIVSIDTSDEDNMLREIIMHIDPQVSQNIITHKCCEIHDYNVYITYALGDTAPANKLAILASQNHEPVFGNCVFLMSDTQKKCDVTFEHIVRMFNSFIFHDAVCVSPGDNIDHIGVIKYNSIPIERSELTRENSKYYVIDIADNSIGVFMENDPEISDDNLNRLATVLCKKYCVYGKIIVGLYTRTPELKMIDMDCATFTNIINLISNSMTTSIEPNDVNSNFYRNIEQLAKYNEINFNIPDDILCGPSMNKIDL